MRVLLVNPHYPISETPSPPLGLAYLAGALEEAGVEVRVADFVVYPYSKEKLQDILADFRPQVVGVTSVTMTFDHAIRVVRDVKATDPEVLTVMGGPHVTFRPVKTLMEFPELDMVVQGEGEEILVSIARELEAKKQWSRIPAVAYRDGAGIHITKSPKKPLSMEQLPRPARHLLPLGRYRALGMPITMTTSRGCPFKCIFCVGRKMGGSRIRFRSPRVVADELESISRLGFPQINIADDLFTANESRCIATCNHIIQRNLNIEWAAFARVDTVTHSLLEKMKEAGCHTLSFGVESASPEILRTIRKGISLDQVMTAVSMCTEVGITPHASFILGLPGETPHTLQQTVDFARRLKDMGASYGFHLLAPFPGTEVREKAEELGIRILTNDWGQYHANRAIVETGAVTKDMMNAIVMEWENKFHEWLGDIERRMHAREATEEEVWQYKKLAYTSIIYDLMMKSIIEDHGTTPVPSPREEPLEALITHLDGTLPHSPQKVREALAFAQEHGNLYYYEENGRLHWQWNDTL
ncbi:MAG: B12-binding domain-containing radical SAM protein [Deltaproteobacteria bacterium]|nr:B12-binding domain-containing radical SAM protein [Deltaproteobacteria bacterium]MBW1928025.1 B12-binding domain-containing radical SAM protein [Deltaproteobacteria bacterium]MBW2024984.1 B12-binding domain-containing radical SAM protein [Deltaproteobacteria bacterium]MBW2126221.1 B12-binding domain-containing radical SAM protein [Deltaproteobacteria bacterium]RLB23903.1 MAG: B12-binding domain-containing radical SAM protein [Deltaproteobacteria bacterium]